MAGTSRSLIQIKGMRELNRRLEAVANPKARREGMQQIGLLALGYVKEETPVKTGNLRRQNRLESVSETGARIVNDAAYSRPVHGGARAHDIVPNRRRVLRWPANASDRRLTGTARNRATDFVFARRVRHPGNEPNPFITRGMARAVKDGGKRVLGAIVAAWNGAA